MVKFILPALSLSLLLAACSQQNEDRPLRTVVAGKIVSSSDTICRFGYAGITDTAAVNTEGAFSIELSLEKEGYVRFWYGGEYSDMYLVPGDSVFMSLDPDQFDESIRYEGTGSEGCNYLAKLYLLNEQIDLRRPFLERYDLNPADFRLLADSIRTARTEHLGSFSQGGAIPAPLVTDQEAVILYSWASSLIEYSDHQQQAHEGDSISIPPDYLNFLSEISLEKPALSENNAYKNFIDTYSGQLARKRLLAAGNAIEASAINREKLRVIDSLIKDQGLKDIFLHSAIMDIMDFNGAQGVAVEMEVFRSVCRDSALMALAEAEFNDWQRLLPGQDAADFRYENVAGEMVALSDFSDKVVYLDVWATWCGPCRREIPHLRELESAYAGKDLSILSISVDSDQADWETFVKDEEMEGIQLIAENGWDSSLLKEYKINGIPRFILIGRDGKIISADAPRPSSGSELHALIDEALQYSVAVN